MNPASKPDAQVGVAERRTCLDCGCTFAITDGERRFYLTTFGEGGLPRRCKRCRSLARQVRTERTLTASHDMRRGTETDRLDTERSRTA